MTTVRLDSVGKRFGSADVLSGVSLDIKSGEFMALLGPSGCGKTTLLRLIAGLERPGSGAIAIGGRPVASSDVFVPPEERDLGMVFQSYALWPHMSVAGNVGFGLAVRKVPAPERRRRIDSALDMVGMGAYAGRKPHELSGGQRQRVALARCLALESGLILLDEPLANLDANLRASMQAEFRRIHKQAGATFVFVTHDQAEAMALADRIAVMDKGRLQQVASPQELYDRPMTAMVAEFVGRGAVLPVEIVGHAGSGCVRVGLAGQTLDVPGRDGAARGWLSVRPEHVEIIGVAQASSQFSAVVEHVAYRGGVYEVDLTLEETPGLRLEARSVAPLAPDSVVGVRLRGGWALPGGDHP